MSPSSTLHSSVLIDGPRLNQPNRRRHTWPWRFGCLVAGLIVGWMLRGLFI